MFPLTGNFSKTVDMFLKCIERTEKPKDYVELGLDAYDYYSIKDSEKA